MKFKALGKMTSKPSMRIDTSVEPIKFKVETRGSLEAGIGPVDAEISEFPVRVAIPFMGPRDELPVVARFGGVRIKLNNFPIKIQSMSFNVDGTMGTEGLQGTMDCKVDCETNMEASGDILGQVSSQLNLGSGVDDD